MSMITLSSNLPTRQHPLNIGAKLLPVLLSYPQAAHMIQAAFHDYLVSAHMTDVFKELVAHFQAAHTAAHQGSQRVPQIHVFQPASGSTPQRANEALEQHLPTCPLGSTHQPRYAMR